jgi:hypothetical protein
VAREIGMGQVHCFSGAKRTTLSGQGYTNGPITGSRNGAGNTKGVSCRRSIAGRNICRSYVPCRALRIFFVQAPHKSANGRSKLTLFEAVNRPGAINNNSEIPVKR